MVDAESLQDELLAQTQEELAAVLGVGQDTISHLEKRSDMKGIRFDPLYPDLQSERNDDFVLIEILFSVGRSVKVKKKIVQDIMTGLSGKGFNPENVMICFKETSWENWSFGGGRFIHM